MIKASIVYHSLFVLFLIAPIATVGQNRLFLKNSSFEEKPKKGSTVIHYIVNKKRNEIDSWYNCAFHDFHGELAPDIHGINTNIWNVKQSPSDGKSFLGLSVRDNNSWDYLSQELSEALVPEKCYSFSIDLSMSKSYAKGSRMNTNDDLKSTYNSPVLLEIWGGASKCDLKELLYVSPAIDH